MQTSLARECAAGLSMARAAQGSSLYALIGGLNWEEGYLVRDSEGLGVTACNASMNGRDGFRLDACRGVILLGSVAMQNSRDEAANYAGVRLTGCWESVVGYALLHDMQGAASTSVRRSARTPPAIVSEGPGTVVRDNLTR